MTARPLPPPSAGRCGLDAQLGRGGVFNTFNERFFFGGASSCSRSRLSWCPHPGDKGRVDGRGTMEESKHRDGGRGPDALGQGPAPVLGGDGAAAEQGGRGRLRRIGSSVGDEQQASRRKGVEGGGIVKGVEKDAVRREGRRRRTRTRTRTRGGKSKIKIDPSPPTLIRARPRRPSHCKSSCPKPKAATARAGASRLSTPFTNP